MVMVTRLRAEGPPCTPHDRLPQGPVAGLELTDPVALREIFAGDRDGHQMVSAKRGSDERKNVRPPSSMRRATETPIATWPGFGAGPLSIAQRQPLTTLVIGFSDRIHCHFSGNSLTAYGTPETNGSTCRNTGIA